jgi:hypothetical protein
MVKEEDTMKMRSGLWICLGVLIAAAGSRAGDDCDTGGGYYRMTNQRYPRYMGAAAGMTTGSGLSYRRWFNDRWGAQVVFFPLLLDQEYPEDSYWGIDGEFEDPDSGRAEWGRLVLGLTVLRTFAEMKYLRFMGFAGGHLNVSYSDYDYYIEEYKYSSDRYATVRKKGREQEEEIKLGAGAGVEYYVWRFAFNLMLGVVGGTRLEAQTYSFTPSVDAGVFFRF